MPTTYLSAGMVHSITQDVVYGLPSQSVWIQSGVAVETSLDGSNWAAVTASTTGFQTSAKFVRCTTGNTVVAVKRLN